MSHSHPALLKKTVTVEVDREDAENILAALKTHHGENAGQSYLVHHFTRVVNYFEAQTSLLAAESWITPGTIDKSRSLDGR
jgi:hypothetical protein